MHRPWQAALEMAWEAYCAGTIPIGAVIVNSEGEVVARGRNRILDTFAPDGQIYNDMLAHAEINALLSLKMDQEERHGASLYTTMEPCPLCMGAFYMSSVRRLHFAARDPYAGSTNLLGATPYLSRKPIKISGPFNAALEIGLIAMMVEREIGLRGEHIISSRYFDEFRETTPQAVTLGISLFRTRELRRRRDDNTCAGEVVNWLANQVQ
ncbi:MAG: nucleoside deaminase [Chloroflexi bacterium]|nr:nucleoside deaminase [Chloroflexota bacterium]